MTTQHCGARHSWWHIAYGGECLMPEDHKPTNLHYDGMAYFDDDGDEVQEEDVPPKVRVWWSRILAGGPS
jgi:hypothetical protein